jgi:hypothetical protein
MINRRITLLMFLFLAMLLLANCEASPDRAASANPLKLYVADSKQYAVYKPADWRVQEDTQPDSFRILLVSPNENSAVDFFWARNENGKSNTLWLLGAYRRYLSQTHTEVDFSEIYISTDSSRAVATVRYRGKTGIVKGRYFFESRPQGLSAQGYCAPEERLAAERPLLLNIMASLAFSKARLAENRGEGTSVFQPQFVRLPLVPRQAQDNSLSLQVPADWKFLGGGGKVVATAPDGGMGFMFTSFSGNPILRNASIAQGVIASPYRPPAQALMTIFNAFGNRNFRVLSSQPDPATDRQFQLMVGRRSETQDLVVSWTSGTGAACLGAFKMINALPGVTGLWFCIVAGIWGPEKDFYRYYPMLEEVGSSFSINDQYARQYIQAGLENLRRLQQQTMAAMQDLNRAREQNQADWESRQQRKEFMESKWDDYRRGNSYWVSELEGGKVYHTDNWGTRDTLTGDYYEGNGYKWTDFEGQNPRYPSENMREVSSYELQRIQGH